jgi:hypothetical protein
MQHISAFYEGLFASISKSTQAESYQPISENNMIDYYLSLLDSVVKENISNYQAQRYDNITAYLSAEFDSSNVKFYTSNYSDDFGSTLKQFISSIESKLASAKDVIVEYAGKTYEIAKEKLTKVLNALQDVFTIAKTKFEEGLRNGRQVLEKVAEMLKMGFDNLRQAFFTAVAYASNSIKTIFAAKKTNLESTNIVKLQNYSSLPISYFVGKLFNEYMFNSEIYDKIVKEDYGHATMIDPGPYGGGGSPNATPVDASKTVTPTSGGSSAPKTVTPTSGGSAGGSSQKIPPGQLYEYDYDIKNPWSFSLKYQEVGKALEEYHKQQTPQAFTKLIDTVAKTNTLIDLKDTGDVERAQKFNTRFVYDVVNKGVSDYNTVYKTDKIIADLIKNGDLKLKDQLLKKLDTDKSFLETLKKYKVSLQRLSKENPETVKVLESLVDKSINAVEKDIEDIQKGLEVVKEIDNNKLLAEKFFRYGIYAVAATGMLYLAYAIAKDLNPIYAMLKTTGLAIGLIVILFAVKYAIEYYVPISVKLKEVQTGNVAVQPEEIIVLVFLVTIGILIGSVVLKATASLDDERRAGAKTGRMLTTL